MLTPIPANNLAVVRILNGREVSLFASYSECRPVRHPFLARLIGSKVALQQICCSAPICALVGVVVFSPQI
ncbi:hypothetical protein SAMN05216516_101277 [Izhakiella capsodis]|uniref:Uncharacterized protein n=1 Tax=Izhakiella capsodis TaxID=1367852 RepID=A0A1I4UQU6_9GAMM|nr:hypothetical protein SAMN05216516_101277 [Izhakiella capsodis]